MPGSAFIPLSLAAARRREYGRDGGTVGETAWNMRAMARAEGSFIGAATIEANTINGALRGLETFSQLCSFDYLTKSVQVYKTPWFIQDKPRFKYRGLLIVTFFTLGEKTTVMSPEFFVKAGIPCCRLVQNPGEFVVTFPRAYHSPGKKAEAKNREGREGVKMSWRRKKAVDDEVILEFC